MYAPLSYSDDAQNDKGNQAGKLERLNNLVQSTPPPAWGSPAIPAKSP
jgi:hypothetical protein